MTVVMWLLGALLAVTMALTGFIVQLAVRDRGHVFRRLGSLEDSQREIEKMVALMDHALNDRNNGIWVKIANVDHKLDTLQEMIADEARERRESSDYLGKLIQQLALSLSHK